jgi:hypothetical protein
MLAGTLHWHVPIMSQINQDHATLQCLISISILSSNLPLILPSGLFCPGFPPRSYLIINDKSSNSMVYRERQANCLFPELGTVKMSINLKLLKIRTATTT